MKQKIQRALAAVKAMLERNWSIWVCLAVVAVAWAIAEFTDFIATPGEDGVLGGFIAILCSEGIRAALRSARDRRRANKS